MERPLSEKGRNMYSILLADDEKDIIKLLRIYLEKEDVTIYEAYDGEMAYMIVQHYDIDLAILDIMMPRMNGFELTEKIRKEYDIPIMIISAKIETADKIRGLDIGADDYIAKPFDPLEVAARVRARLRSSSKNSNGSNGINGTTGSNGSRSNVRNSGSDAAEMETISVRNLTLHLAECVLFKDSLRIPLTSVEFRVLRLFMQKPGRVFTKEQIYEAGWGENYAVDDNTIRVAISKLRDKVGEDQITTLRGLGYRLEK